MPVKINWLTIDEARAIPAGSVIVSRMICPGLPPKYAISSDDSGPFDPADLDELAEFMNGYPDHEVHILLIDGAPNATR